MQILLRKPFIIAFLVFSLPTDGRAAAGAPRSRSAEARPAEEPSSPKSAGLTAALGLIPFPIRSGSYYYLVPGLGHFYQGNGYQAASYFLSETTLFALGTLAESYLSEDPLYPERNVFLQLSWQEHMLGIFTSFREAKGKTGGQDGRSYLDDTPVGHLLSAPFRPRYLRRPTVYIPAVLAATGVVLTALIMEPSPPAYPQLASVRALGVEWTPFSGLSYYGVAWGLWSLGAAVGEECLFRGVLQSECARSFGDYGGLFIASFLFGLAHLGLDRMGGGEGNWRSAVNAGCKGLYFGWRYLREGYRLSESIAAHFWWDFAYGVTQFLVNPQENNLGLQVTLSL